MRYRARFAAPVCRPPLENAVIDVHDGRIVALESAPSATPTSRENTIDFGDAIILPGLINAHTHLELTALHGRVPYTGRFTDWAAALVALRHSLLVRESLLAPHPARDSLRDGIARSLRAGTTTVGDIGYGRRQIDELRRSPLRAVCFMETLGIGRKSDRAMPLLEERLAGAEPDPPHTLIGVSPHAPYSTDEAVYRACVDWARRLARPLCTHLAETPAEIEFLLTGRGEFRKLLDRLDLLPADFAAPACRPIDFAASSGLLDARALLVHVNYISDAELDRLARARCPVAFCPRSHRFFDHAPHRFRELLAAGLPVAIGTDSLASNDTLSILDECRFLLDEHPDLDPDTVLRMATEFGAAALGLDDRGLLAPGLLADFTIIPTTACSPASALESALRSGRPPSDVVINGRFALRHGTLCPLTSDL